jgi:hypothetical protein
MAWEMKGRRCKRLSPMAFMLAWHRMSTGIFQSNSSLDDTTHEAVSRSLLRYVTMPITCPCLYYLIPKLISQNPGELIAWTPRYLGYICRGLHLQRTDWTTLQGGSYARLWHTRPISQL